MAVRTKTDEPILSVVIIARNEEAYIGRCIESVLLATEPLGRCEMVFVDSNSDDRTVEIARTYRIRVVELARHQRCSPAMGRYVGTRLTQGKYVLFVDGDTTIDPNWVTTALAVLVARPDLAGVAGREDQIYYRAGAVIGDKTDYFATGDVEGVVEQFGGNAVYRRQALDAVGSFNPYLRSFEEAELGARLRQAGWQLVRIPAMMGHHHTPKPDGLDEYWRRLRTHLFAGQGQVLRIAIRQGLFREHARKLNRVLLFMLWVVVGGGAAFGSLSGWGSRPIAMWLAASAVLVMAFVVRSRSLTKPFRLIFDWAVCSVPLAWGFLVLPANPARFRLEDAVAADQLGVTGADRPEAGRARVAPPEPVLGLPTQVQ